MHHLFSLPHFSGVFPKACARDAQATAHLLLDAADALGHDNLFSRYAFDDGRTIVTLGYSVVRYGQRLRPPDLALIEQTYGNETDFVFPRPGIAEGTAKTSLYLKSIEDLVQTYESCDGRDSLQLRLRWR
jgi:hypothetical protein